MAYASDLCGSKLRAKLSTSMNEASSEKISTTSFAAKQMAKMGWEEGTGLGKKRDGIVSHIKVKKREDKIGIGVEKERTRKMGVEGMWWSASVADTLSKLHKNKIEENGDGEKSKKKKNKKEKKNKKRKRDSMSDNDAGKIYTDDELFKATGGARFGTKGGKRSEGKWQRSEKSKELKEWEKGVKEKIEWNGLGKASVILDTTVKPQNNKKGCKDMEKNSENQSSESQIESESDQNKDGEVKKSRKKQKSEKKMKKKKKKDKR